VAADVVDDLRACLNGQAGCLGVVGVDRDDRLGTRCEDCFEDRQNARLLFRGSERDGIGAGRFAAEIEQVGTVVEHFQRAADGSIGVEKLAAVRKGIGRDVENPHDESAFAERQNSGTKAPAEARANSEGHNHPAKERADSTI
jgi:hypothetical protein